MMWSSALLSTLVGFTSILHTNASDVLQSYTNATCEFLRTGVFTQCLVKRTATGLTIVS
jgi:hypothetical protein